MNPKHARHREHPPIRKEVSRPCGGIISDMRPAGRGGDSEYDLNSMAIHGMHDDAWAKAMHEKYPGSVVFKAWAYPELLSEAEMRIAVAMTGDAGIALDWVRKAGD